MNWFSLLCEALYVVSTSLALIRLSRSNLVLVKRIEILEARTEPDRIAKAVGDGFREAMIAVRSHERSPFQ
jgi:hypothetical protein